MFSHCSPFCCFLFFLSLGDCKLMFLLSQNEVDAVGSSKLKNAGKIYTKTEKEGRGKQSKEYHQIHTPSRNTLKEEGRCVFLVQHLTLLRRFTTSLNSQEAETGFNEEQSEGYEKEKVSLNERGKEEEQKSDIIADQIILSWQCFSCIPF